MDTWYTQTQGWHSGTWKPVELGTHINIKSRTWQEAGQRDQIGHFGSVILPQLFGLMYQNPKMYF